MNAKITLFFYYSFTKSTIILSVKNFWTIASLLCKKEVSSLFLVLMRHFFSFNATFFLLLMLHFFTFNATFFSFNASFFLHRNNDLNIHV